MNPKISIQNTFFTYADGTEALKDITFDIHPNQVFVLFGPARSGKTTLLRMFNRLTYGLKMAGITDRVIHEERVERSLKQAALWDEAKDRLDQSAFALSGGQKQRLCIARSLALEPEVILLDNPTSGLDPISTGVVEESLYELKQRYTIVMVPHSIQQAARVADRAALLLDGE